MRILLIASDRTVARGLTLTLQQQRMVTDIANCGAEALELAKLYDYDAALVDASLPDMEGFDLIARLRASRFEAPLLLLSSIGRAEAKIRALNAGADDYLTKPFDPGELTARLHALIRRAKGLSRPSIQMGAILLDLAARQLSVQGVPVHLTGKEYSILELLLLRRGTALSKENILDHLYGGMDEPDSKIIDVFICKLRKKLQQAGANNIIGTVWGRGYMIHNTQTPAIRDVAVNSELALAA